MTHIDPFAPADSDQHPSRWKHDPHGTADLGAAMRNPRDEYEDGVPFWIAIENEPISLHDPESLNKSADRWKEYRALLAEHGADEQLAIYEEDWASWSRDDMPTLAELREKHVLADEPEDPKDQTGELISAEPLNEPPTPSSDLEAKLAALKEAGL